MSDVGAAGPSTLARERDPHAPFFDSRWVTAPGHVRDLGVGTGLPAGFRASGVAAAIRREGELDVGLLVCDSADAVSAARFCDSAASAAPVQLCRERCRLDALRAVVVNSGIANAATGGRGRDEAARTQGAGAAALALPENRVAVASTGVIGVQLPGRRMISGVLAASHQLRADGDGDFTAAIMTTDAFQKRASVEVTLENGGAVRVTAQCKGAGMISPRFATMLCFVQTDAALQAVSADRMLGDAVAASFDRVSVDGQLSTNDTVILIASGVGGVAIAPDSEDERRFAAVLRALLLRLALLIVADGEGAQRVGRVVVRGGDEAAVSMSARAIANSPLVKTALNGGDPNWGRVVQAVGGALGGARQVPIDVTIEGVKVCAASAAARFDEQALAQAVKRAEVQYEVDLPGRGCEADVFFSDLSHGYVTINADYTT